MSGARRVYLAPHEEASWGDRHRGAFSRWLAVDARFQDTLTQLYLAFQPIVTLPGNDLLGFEALLRGPRAAMAGPLGFLAEAERLGCLHDLGRTVRRLAAGSMSRLESNALLFVNVHQSDLFDDDLFDRSAPLSGFAPRVVLEISERARLGDIPDLGARLAALRRLGYALAVDDLGAEHAGLGTFLRLVPEYAKLDIEFVSGIDTDPLKQAVVGSVAGLCRNRGIRAVAEGVERVAEWNVLVGLGVAYAQGFLVSPPRRLEDMQGCLMETPQAPGVDSD